MRVHNFAVFRVHSHSFKATPTWVFEAWKKLKPRIYVASHPLNDAHKKSFIFFPIYNSPLGITTIMSFVRSRPIELNANELCEVRPHHGLMRIIIRAARQVHRLQNIFFFLRSFFSVDPFIKKFTVCIIEMRFLLFIYIMIHSDVGLVWGRACFIMKSFAKSNDLYKYLCNGSVCKEIYEMLMLLLWGN